MVFESIRGFLGSPLTFIGLSTNLFEGTVNGESAFIAVDGECTVIDEE